MTEMKASENLGLDVQSMIKKLTECQPKCSILSEIKVKLTV